MNNTELLDQVEMLYNLLLGQVRGSNETALRGNVKYQELRTFLLQDENIKLVLPRFVRTSRDLMQFWVYIRGTYAHYHEREGFLREQFAPVFDMLESGLSGTKSNPSDVVVATSSPSMPPSLPQTQTSGGVVSSSGRDTNIQGDIVGRDKITSNTTSITNNYFRQDINQPKMNHNLTNKQKDALRALVKLGRSWREEFWVIWHSDELNDILDYDGNPPQISQGDLRALEKEGMLICYFHHSNKAQVTLTARAYEAIDSNFDTTDSSAGPAILSILFLAADPTDASRLRLGEELREIQEKIQLAKSREQFAVHQRMSIRPTDISQALLDVNPNIVHFSGHGTDSGELCVENRIGEIHPIQPEALAALFELFAGQVNCVILNACYSALQAQSIAKHVRYVIGMNQAIGDKAAIAFAVGFYQALGAGRSIEDAYKLGCVQIRLENIPEHLTPVILSNTSISSNLASFTSNGLARTVRVETTKVKAPAVTKPYNLSFEGPVIKGQPDGWFNSLGFVDYASASYEVAVVSRPDNGGGLCVLFQNQRASSDEFGSLMQRCPAKHLAGKTVRFEGEVKTKNIQNWAGLWLRADGDSAFNLFFDNMSERAIRGSTPWTRYSIDARLPQETTWLNYGIVLDGRGAMWADNFRLLVWNDAEKWIEL